MVSSVSRVPTGRAGAGALAERYGAWALVTGASDGIGREFALAVAEGGMNVVLVARRQERLAELAQTIRTDFGVEATVLAADLTDPVQLDGVIEATAGLDLGLLVASAGFGTSGPLARADPDTELSMLAVNCRALLVLTRMAAERFSGRGRGGIVLMGSLLGFQGVPGSAHYAATKAYVQTLAEGLRVELAGFGVDVLSSSPGPVRTGFADRANMRYGPAESARTVARQSLRALGRRATVRPGLLAKALHGSTSLLPRAWRVRVMGRVMAGLTAHH